MKEFKGTPGPWHYDDELGVVYSKGGQFVCDVTDKDNANLISAAHELLKALQLTVHDVGHWLSTQKPELKEKIESAINKALENETSIDKKYEAALAASQKPAWNGEGLPPVGCECEWRDANVGWLPVTIKYISEQIVVMASQTNCCGVQELTEIAKDIICDKPQFRPLRSEADKKRDEVVQEILKILEGPGSPYSDVEARKIYDAIAAGKIPGVKLEG